MWKWIERISVLWTLFSIVAIVLDALGVLPWYDIYYKKKTDITPIVFVHPNQTVRLSAQFASSVDFNNLESVRWTLKDATGKEYKDLPRLREVDVALLPDFSGVVNMDVRAKVFGEASERSGFGSIHIVQDKPYQMVEKTMGTFALPPALERIEPKGVELYAGSMRWLPAIYSSSGEKVVHLNTGESKFSLWGGKALLRYKSTDDSKAEYKYEALTALATEPEAAPKIP